MRQQGNVPSSVISSHSMHLGVLATAWHAIQTNTMFTVYYKPRYVARSWSACLFFSLTCRGSLSQRVKYISQLHSGKLPHSCFCWFVRVKYLGVAVTEDSWGFLFFCLVSFLGKSYLYHSPLLRVNYEYIYWVCMIPLHLCCVSIKSMLIVCDHSGC